VSQDGETSLMSTITTSSSMLTEETSNGIGNRWGYLLKAILNVSDKGLRWIDTLSENSGGVLNYVIGVSRRISLSTLSSTSSMFALQSDSSNDRNFYGSVLQNPNPRLGWGDPYTPSPLSPGMPLPGDPFTDSASAPLQRYQLHQVSTSIFGSLIVS
jgi:hypothetical protein